MKTKRILFVTVFIVTIICSITVFAKSGTLTVEHKSYEATANAWVSYSKATGAVLLDMLSYSASVTGKDVDILPTGDKPILAIVDDKGNSLLYQKYSNKISVKTKGVRRANTYVVVSLRIGTKARAVRINE